MESGDSERMQKLELERTTTQVIGSKPGAQNRLHSFAEFLCLLAVAILLVGWKVSAVQAVETGITSFRDNVRSKVCMYDPEQTKQTEELLGSARFIDAIAREMRGGTMVRHRLEFTLQRGDRLHLNW
jgi:hypothetical protein